MDEKTQRAMNSLIMTFMSNLTAEDKAELEKLDGKELIDIEEMKFQAAVEKHNAENVNSGIAGNCEACNIEREFYNAKFDDYKPQNETQQKALNVVKELVAKKTGKVILLGANGLGKSFLGAIAVKLLGGKMYTIFEISCLIREAYSSLAKKTELEILEELASVPMLCIDELGRSKSSEAERNWLSYVIDKRHTRGLPLIICGNVHLMKDCSAHGCPHCFEKFFGRDVLSRFKQNTRIVSMQGKDWRENHCLERYK